MTPLQKIIKRRYGAGGGGNFAYHVDTLMNQYIVYAPTMMRALDLYKRYHTYEPHSIRQMSDNE